MFEPLELSRVGWAAAKMTRCLAADHLNMPEMRFVLLRTRENMLTL